MIGFANQAPPLRGAPLERRVPLLVVIALLAACPAERRGVTRDSLLDTLDETKPRAPTSPPPTIAELAALRVPAPAALPPELAAMKPATALQRARLAIALRGDLAAAEQAWGQGASAQERVELLAHRCLVEEAVRRYEPLVDACAGFVAAAPADPRAPMAVLILERATSAIAKARAVVLEQGLSWIDACGKARKPDESCADLAHVVSAAVRDAASVVKDEAKAKEAVRRGGSFVKAQATGPYVGEPLVAFADDEAGRPLKLTPVRGSVRTLGAWDGRFAPAARGDDGPYKLVFSGRGEGPATLYVSSGVITRVKVDGEVVVERRPRERFEPRASRVSLQLSPGAHRVEVLVGALGRADQVQVSLLKPDGAPALAPLPPDAPAPKGASATMIRAARGAVEGVPFAGDDDVLSALDRLQWRHVLARSGQLGVSDDEARIVVRRLLDRAGFAPQALVVAAQAVGDDPTVPERFAAAAAQPLWARVLNVWPDHPVARISAARQLREERPDEALAAFRALVAARPDYPFGWRDLVHVALERGVVDEAVQAADFLLAKDRSPENVDAALPALRSAGRVAEAAKLERARAREEHFLYGDDVARRLLDAGRTADAVMELARIADADPGNVAVEQLWDLLELSDPPAALARVERHLQLFPNDVAAHRRRARLALALKGEEAGRDAVQKALDRFGGDEELRRMSEHLGTKPLWFDRLALGDRTIEAARAAKQEPFPGHPVVMLIDHVERHVYEDESSILVRHWIALLKTKDVLDRFGEVSLGRDERLLRLRVVKPDGSVLEPEHHKNVDDISLTGLAPGDIVEMLTTTTARGPMLEGVSFETRTLDGSTPAGSRGYVLTMPPGFAEQHGLRLVALHGVDPVKPVPTMEDGRRPRLRVAYEARNAAPILDEPNMPMGEDLLRLVGFAYGLDDDAWALIRGRPVLLSARADPWLQDAAKKIAGEGPARARFERLFDFVVRRIEEAPAPDDAVEVLATGRGSRTPLLYALARAADLDVDLVAVNPPEAPSLDVPLTSRWRRVGVRAKAGEQDAWAFVDDGLAVLDGMPPRLQGAQALILDDDVRGAARRLPLPDTAIALDPARIRLDLAAGTDGALTGKLTISVPPSMSEGMRRGMRSATPDQLEAWLERALGDSFPGVRVEEAAAASIGENGAPLVVTANVAVPSVATGGEPVRFEHLFAQGASAGFGLFTPIGTSLRVADRKLPLMVYAEAEVLDVRIALPKGAAFTEVPSKLLLDAGPFRLEQRAEVTEGMLVWSRTLSTKNARIAAAGWPSLRAALSQLSARTDARLAYVLPKKRPDSGAGTGRVLPKG